MTHGHGDADADTCVAASGHFFLKFLAFLIIAACVYYLQVSKSKKLPGYAKIVTGGADIDMMNFGGAGVAVPPVNL